MSANLKGENVDKDRWNEARKQAVQLLGEEAASLAIEALFTMIESVFALSEETGIPEENIMEAILIIMQSYHPREGTLN